MDQDLLYQTAIHEAGHAVIAIALGKRFKDVSIRSKDDYLGRVKYWTSKKALIESVQGFSSNFLNQATIDKRVRSAIIISYAGYVAQLKTGIDDPEGAAFDFKTITNIGLNHAGEDVDNFLSECFEVTKQTVDENWTYILIVAQQLLNRKTISGKDIDKDYRKEMKS